LGLEASIGVEVEDVNSTTHLREAEKVGTAFLSCGQFGDAIPIEIRKRLDAVQAKREPRK
jgi:hypothetical protein